ncbi:TPA: hypothetical protein N0F65_011692, partial [Lagenidium giganteum]
RFNLYCNQPHDTEHSLFPLRELPQYAQARENNGRAQRKRMMCGKKCAFICSTCSIPESQIPLHFIGKRVEPAYLYLRTLNDGVSSWQFVFGGKLGNGR